MAGRSGSVRRTDDDKCALAKPSSASAGDGVRLMSADDCIAMVSCGAVAAAQGAAGGVDTRDAAPAYPRLRKLRALWLHAR